MGNSLTDEEYWKKSIKRTCFKINLAWFFSVIAKPLSVALFLLSGLIFYLRWQNVDGSIALPTVGAFLSFTVLVVGWILLRGKWEKKEQTVSRIEDELSLHNALSMAERGAVSYPKQRALPRLFTWRSKYFLPPMLFGMTGVALAVFLPISDSINVSYQIQEPQSWSQLEEDLQLLEEEELIQEEYLDEKEKELAELREQNPTEWYDHSSLEASDHLMDQHQEQKENLTENLSQAAEQLQSMQNAQGSPGAIKAAYNEYQEALESMENSEMKPNKELLIQMAEISPESLKKLSPEDVEKLKERMEGMSQKMGEGGEGDAGEELKDGKRQGEGCEGECAPGECPNGKCPGGSPEVNRGPGHDEYLYGETHERLQGGAEGALEAKDLSSFTPGDLLELQSAAPEASKDSNGVRLSARTEHLGEGGDRVWKQALLPAEQDALKSYFSHDTDNK